LDKNKEGLARLLGNTFIQRRDVKAIQSSNGAYRPDKSIRSYFSLNDIIAHIDGSVSYGHYLLDNDNHCKILAFDIDLDNEYLWHDQLLNPRITLNTDHPARLDMIMDLRSVADGLGVRLKRMYPKLTVMHTYSGNKGIHVYGAFPQATTAKAAISVAESVIDWYGCFAPSRGNNFFKHTIREIPITIEVFPKQAKTTSGGFGNLLRLPLGINQKTKKHSFFYSIKSPLEYLISYDPIAALTTGTVNFS
jgi:hypothetical protein